MKIDDLVSQYRDEINIGLSKIYLNGPNTLAKPVNYVLEGGGKRLRSLLTLFSAEACGGSKDDAMSVALAVELLHNFTLVHDDIMDQDQIRHGQKTVHYKWDDGIAILTGDAILSLALKLLNNSESAIPSQMKIFIEGLLAVCEGQALDKEFESREVIIEHEYLEMIDLKTGHLIGLSAELGAISSNADPIICKAIRDYGRLIGRAFQIQDDYLEIFSDSISMGKTLKSDIVLGKKTYLIIKAMEKNKELISNALQIVQSDFDTGFFKIREYLVNEGINQKTLDTINLIIDQANSKISNLSIDLERIFYFSDLIKKRGH